MSNRHSRARRGTWIAVSTCVFLVVPCSLILARTPIEERRPADPQGSVEIANVSGSVRIEGWERPEVEVTGTAGDQAGKVEVTTQGTLTSIRVEPRDGWGFGHDRDADLVVHVPAKSAVSATLVSADVKVSGVQGDLKLQTVSGEIRGEVGGDVRASTVSGDVQLTARSARTLEIHTISGDIGLNGSSGEVQIATVSGDARLELSTLTRGRLRSVSGDVSASLELSPDGQLDGESVSGKIQIEFARPPAADFDVQTYSGDIENCFGPKPAEPHHGPGARLVFKNGDGHARVRIATKSGDVRLCVKGTHPDHVSFVPDTPAPARRIEIPYMI